MKWPLELHVLEKTVFEVTLLGSGETFLRNKLLNTYVIKPQKMTKYFIKG